METILDELNEAIGIRGSMIVTKDGMLVTSRVGAELSEDAIAALVSAVVLSTRKALERIRFGEFTRFLLKSTEGKIILQDAGVAFLVVVADTRIKLDVTLIDINRATYRIEKHFEA